MPAFKKLNCPLCGQPSIKVQNDYKCPMNHVWHFCKVHGKQVITSLIGELSKKPFNNCSCNLDLLKSKHKPPKLPKPEKQEVEQESKQKVEININLITPEGIKKIDGRESNFLPYVQVNPCDNMKVVPNLIELNEKEKKDKCKRNNDIKRAIEKYLGISLTAAATKEKNPTPSNPPLHISSRSKPLWKEFCAKYSKVWKPYTETEEKWSVAVAIWRNYCIKRNLPPFDEPTVDSQSTQYMANRIQSSRQKALDMSKTFINFLLRKGYANRLYVEKIDDIKYIGGIFTITTSRKIKTDMDLKNQEFRNWLKLRKFNPKIGKFYREVNGLCMLIICMEDGEMYLKTQYKLPSQLVSLALRMDANSLKDKDKAIKSVSSFFKKLIKDTK